MLTTPTEQMKLRVISKSKNMELKIDVINMLTVNAIV